MLDDLRALVERRQWPCVSLYLPTHRAAGQTREDPIHLRNAVARAKERLVAAGYPKDRAAELLEPARSLIGSRNFWLHQADGLAVFVAPDWFRYYQVPLPLEDEVIVADHFSVRQLIPLFTEDGRFYILALSQKQVRLFEATRTSIHEKTVPDMPKGIDDLKQYDEAEVQLQAHTMVPAQGSGTGTIFHGQGNIADKARYKVDVIEYLRLVSRKLEKYLDAQTAPLVLAAVEYEQSFYRQVNSYHNLLEKGVVGSPDDRDEHEIHRAAWEVVEPHFTAARETGLQRFADLSGTDRTSDRLEEILPAACHGRVQILFIQAEARIRGKFQPDSLSVEVHGKPDEDDVDLIDLACFYALQSRSAVYALHRHQMPTGRPQAAIFRY